MVGFIELDPALHKALQGGQVGRRGPPLQRPRLQRKPLRHQAGRAYDHFTKVYPVKEVADASA